MPTSRVTTASVAECNGHRRFQRHAAASGSSEATLGRAGSAEAALTIDCDCCTLRNTDACDDCVVSFLLGREPDDAVVIDADEARAMRMLERAGLLPDPALQHPGRLSDRPRALAGRAVVPVRPR